MTDRITSFFPALRTHTYAELPRLLTGLLEACPGHPFSEPVMEFLGSVSGRLLSAQVRGRHPQLAALGFWTRPSILAQLKARYEMRVQSDNAIMVPRGLAFHLPPANVDVLFAYSWFLSLLAGNSNVIRVPRTLNSAAENLLEAIAAEAERLPEICRSSLLVHYPHTQALNKVMSDQCNVRVVWGGDTKIVDVRAVPLPPNAIQVEFPDRFSYAAIKASSYESLSESARLNLAERLFNDVYWFDQMGCASPRLVFWVGGPRIPHDLANDLSLKLAETANAKGYRVDAPTAMAKFAFADRFALDLPVDAVHRFSNELTVVTLQEPVDFRGRTMGAGFLVQVFVREVTDIAGFAQVKDQTLTQFGFERQEVNALVHACRGRGLDRIVPIGRALDFHHIWDGIDLLSSFSRLVFVG